jgi:hypothetical protein
VDGLVDALRRHGPVVVEEREVTRERIRFLAPPTAAREQYLKVTPESNTGR